MVAEEGVMIGIEFLKNVFINTSFIGTWYIYQVMIIFASCIIVSRDPSDWKTLALPMAVGWHLVGFNISLIILIPLAILFTIENLSITAMSRMIGSVADVISDGVGATKDNRITRRIKKSRVKSEIIQGLEGTGKSYKEFMREANKLKIKDEALGQIKSRDEAERELLDKMWVINNKDIMEGVDELGRTEETLKTLSGLRRLPSKAMDQAIDDRKYRALVSSKYANEEGDLRDRLNELELARRRTKIKNEYGLDTIGAEGDSSRFKARKYNQNVKRTFDMENQSIVNNMRKLQENEKNRINAEWRARRELELNKQKSSVELPRGPNLKYISGRANELEQRRMVENFNKAANARRFSNVRKLNEEEDRRLKKKKSRWFSVKKPKRYYVSKDERKFETYY